MKRTTGFLLLIRCCLLYAHLLKHARGDALTTAAVPTERTVDPNVTTHTWETASNLYSHLYQ